MTRIYPKIQKIRNYLAFYIQKVSNGKHEHLLLRIGETIVVEGGPSTGKTSFIKKAMRKLEENGQKYIYINGALPLYDWVRDYKLLRRNLDARIEYLLSHTPDNFYLLVDNAEKIGESRKLEVILTLLSRARGAVVACTNFSALNSKLRVRLENARIISLGAGADTFDITYFVVAVLIIIVALIGAYNLVFLAAAMRYIFQGTRIGGKR